ncbi:xanthine dehydrogenase family protein subunit M [Nonomuraea antimicrobica]|uniref:Xanthine dehydrogenase family protein subunit M n=1 Tax=Nonomuraea antimicrobica TaxID=561173 RepID=A0ABP7BI07_9ACTN
MRPFAYAAPVTLAEAVRVLSEAGPGAKVLAGGTTLYDLMRLDIETPPTVVDVRALRELGGMDTSGPDELWFGAGALMADVAEDPVLVNDYPALAESLAKAASHQLRNMATVAGNLLQRTRCAYFRGRPAVPCNKRRPGSGCAAIGGLDRGHALLGGSDACVATYPGDWAVALIAFDALVDVAGPAGERTLALADLHLEPGDTPDKEHTLSWDEIVTRIRVPVTRAGRGSTYHKVRDRESYAFALASAAAAVTLDGGGAVRECRIAVGGLATRPWRCHEAERELTGTPLDRRAARRAGEAALAGARPGTHNAFRVELGVRTVAEALRIAGERAVR